MVSGVGPDVHGLGLDLPLLVLLTLLVADGKGLVGM